MSTFPEGQTQHGAMPYERRQRGLPDRFFLASARFVEKKNLKNVLLGVREMGRWYRRRHGDSSCSAMGHPGGVDPSD
jgi:hypothetical protein